MRIAGRIPHEFVLRALLGARNGGGTSRSCLAIGTVPDPNSKPIFGSAAHFKDCLKIADVIVASDELTEVFGECKQELWMHPRVPLMILHSTRTSMRLATQKQTSRSQE